MRASDSLKHSTLMNQRPEQVRHFLPRALRRLLALFMTICLVVSLVAAVAAFQPFSITVPTPMFAYSQAIAPVYSVNLTPSAPFSDRSLPAGRIYAREHVESVTVNVDITQRMLWLGSLSTRSQVEAVLQVQSLQNPNVLLMEKRSPLLAVEEAMPSLAAQTVSRSVTVPLAPYREAVAAFAKESGAAGNAILLIRLTAETTGSRFGQSISSRQSADVAIPLTADAFQIAVSPAATRQLVSKQVRYLIQPDALPPFVYPTISALLLLALVLFLAMTANRPVRRFQRDLNRLLRKGRRQILMIADKAWEPEWCVSVSSFDSMVQTARRLRHPIFCYVDNDPDEPAAYFYVYYGENNYCHVFTGKPEDRRSGHAAQSAGLPGPMRSAGRLNSPSDSDHPEMELTHAPILQINRGGASGSALTGGAGDPTGTAPGLPGAAASRIPLSDDPGARFQTGAFKPLADPSAPVTVVPASSGPLRPSPEPFLDLIRGTWPAEPSPDETATAGQLDRGDRVQPTAGLDTYPAKPATPAGRAQRPDSESAPMPILPDTDAGFSSLF